MLGLILKDLMIQRRNFTMYAVILIVITGVGMITEIDFGAYTIMMGAFIAVMPLLQTFRDDELTHWDRYATIMPISRNKIVLSRYATLVVGFLIGQCAMVLNCLFVEGFFGLFPIEMMILIAESTLFFGFVVVPLNLKFGSKYAGIMTLVMFYGALGSAAGIMKMGVVEFNLKAITWYGAVVVLVVAVFSVWSSCYISKKKEY